MDFTNMNNSFVIQSLLQKADELTNLSFGSNSKVTIVGEEEYSPLNSFNSNITTANYSSDLDGLELEEFDGAIANQIGQSLLTPTVYPQYQSIDASSTVDVALDMPTSALDPTPNYNGELFQDPNGPQIIRRPPIQGPLTYRQNISVRYLQPPPLPPPGPLIIKEVRPPQPPAPPPLIIRQRAPPLPTPPPLILRERPPQVPPPIPTQTVIRKVPPTPVPPRSIIVERFPPIPPPPRDIIIERWLPYSKEPQRRKIITHRAPPPPSYPPPRNIIIVYEPIKVNVVRSIHRVGIQPQNPEEYISRYGNTLLDTSTLLAQAQHAGILDDISPPLSSSDQQYQINNNAEYYLNNAQPVWDPGYDYSTSSWENQVSNNNEQSQVYSTDPQEDINAILQRLGVAVE